MPSFFPLGVILFTVGSVLLAVVSKFVSFNLPTSLRPRDVCSQVVWLKVNLWGRKSFELSVLSLGRGFLIRDNEHGFEKSGYHLLSLWALDFTLICHSDADIAKLGIALFLPTPGSSQLPVSLNTCSSVMKWKSALYLTHLTLERGISAGSAFAVFRKPAKSLQLVVHFNNLCESGRKNLSNFNLMWWKPQLPLVTAPLSYSLQEKEKIHPWIASTKSCRMFPSPFNCLALW